MHGQDREVDVFDVKCHIENILSLIGAPSKFQIYVVQNPIGTLAAWAYLSWPEKTIGVFGELHPKILSSFDIKGPTVGFTILLDNIPTPRNSNTTRPPFRARSLQAVERDLLLLSAQR